MKKNKNFYPQPEASEMKEIENLYKSKEFDALITKTRKLISKFPEVPILFNILGIGLQKKNNLDEAIKNFSKAIELKSDFDHAHNNLGNTLRHFGKLKESISHFKQAIKINPNYAEAYNNQGLALKDLRKFDESILSFNHALKINPNYAEAYSNLGIALNELGKFEEAILNHRKAIKINPNYAEAYSNLGIALGELGKFEEAISSHKKSQKLNPKYTLANLNEAMIRLSLGEFEAGWKKYEYRFDQTANPMRYPHNKLWDGKYLNGNLLVWGEQGIGDHIIFASMITDLVNHAKNIILEIDNRLINLFERYFKKKNFTNIKVIGLKKKKLFENFDKHIAIGSLGMHLRKNKKSFQTTPQKYLLSSNIKMNELKKKYFNEKKFTIGISWKTLNKKQPYRNIDLEQLLPILSNSNCNFINLQFGNFDDELNNLKLKHGIDIKTIKEVDNYNDIDSLAALVECLDLVITIQNSTAHLAAALGQETWIMLVKNENARWHWTIGEKNSFWYPTVKLFRQENFKDWNSVIKGINTDLKKKLK